MKIINLVKSEFIKNYSIKRFVIIGLIFFFCSLLVMKFMDDNPTFSPDDWTLENYIFHSRRVVENCEEYDGIHGMSCKYRYSKEIDYYNLIKDLGVESSFDWRVEAIRYDLMPFVVENYYIDIIKDKNKDNEIINILNGNYDNVSCDNVCEKINYLYKNYTLDELDKLYEKNNLIIEEYINLFKQDKFYLYLDYQVKNEYLEGNEMIDLIINKKVESNLDYLGLNYEQYRDLHQNVSGDIVSEDEYKRMGIAGFNSYDDYVAFYKKLQLDGTKFRKIILYSTKHEIKHDIIYNTENLAGDFSYINTKLSVNRIFHFSVIITLIIAISNSGIVSKEHSKGTIKNIITAPVKRWKMLLSKFIYLILDMYMIWFIALIILSIVSGFKFGFGDLFDPKLVYTGEKVIEVNYYLYLLKNIFIASIPVICFLSILFFLSTVSLNTSLTVGIMSGLSVVSFVIWFVGFRYWFPNISYTPFWYLDCGFIFNNSQLYMDSLYYGVYELSTGLIISVIVTIVLYIISTIVYIKRDIKT